MAGDQVMSDAYVENGCRHKVRHASKAAAKRSARETLTNRGGRALVAYRCLSCGGFHVGHPWTKEQRATARHRGYAAPTWEAPTSDA